MIHCACFLSLSRVNGERGRVEMCEGLPWRKCSIKHFLTWRTEKCHPSRWCQVGLTRPKTKVARGRGPRIIDVTEADVVDFG